jgi:hypothetical protein
MELKLQTQNVKTLSIEGEIFEVDCNSLKAIQALDDFTKATQKVESVDQALIDLCHRCIDNVLGTGAYARLFKGMNESIAPFYLCLDLARIYSDEFMKDERAAREREAKENMDQLEKMTRSMETLTKASDLAQSKYGAGNAATFNRRASGKHYRR